MEDGGGDPTSNGGTQNGSSVGIRTRCMHVFCTFGVDLYAQSVLVNKVSASELSQKFIKSALLVGRRGVEREKRGGGRESIFLMP